MVNLLNWIVILGMLFQAANARIQFLPKEQLLERSEYIVLATVQTAIDTGKTIHRGASKGKVIENKLKIVELIKGTLPYKKLFVLKTLKFDDWMEDNVELPPVHSEVLLFLERDKKGNMKPVNGIQGVWKIDSDGKSNYGTLKEIQEIAQKQADQVKKGCSNKAFTTLLDAAETQTQAGHYKEALKAYRKVYAICPMKDIEGQMAWLMGEVGE